MRKAALLVLLLTCGTATAQDLEPRRWAQMPTGINFAGIGLGFSSGDISLDPVLQIEDGEFELTFAAAAYIRTFGLFGKSARFDVHVPYVSGHWEGLLAGEFTEVRRVGFGDPRFRLSVLLYGAPAETQQEFAKSRKSSTVVGAAIAITAPFGEYFEDKLINLGSNRWVVRPQLGITHTRGKWSYELTGSVFLFADNDDFYNNSRLESDPLYALQGHVIHTFRPGLWVSASTAYGSGARATINGVNNRIDSTNWLSGLSMGLPVTRRQGLRVTYLRQRTQESTGSNSDSVVLSYSVMF